MLVRETPEGNNVDLRKHICMTKRQKTVEGLFCLENCDLVGSFSRVGSHHGDTTALLQSWV